MKENADYGFITDSTARTEATEAKVTKVDKNAGSANQTSQDENLEESATSKQNDSDDQLDEESIDTDESDDAQNDEQKPKKNNLKKRFSKLTQQKRDAEDRALKAETLLAQMQQQGSNKSQQEEQPHANQQESVEGKPDPNNFDTHAEYLEALYDWKDAEKEKKNKESAEKTKAEKDALNVQQAYDVKVKEFEKNNPDFHEVIDEVVHLVKSPVFLEAILTSDFGPEIAYELAKKPEEIQRLQSVSATALYKEIGKLEDKFSKASQAAKETKEVTLSKAPRPISPVGGGSTSVTKNLYDPNISFSDYEAIRLKQLNKK